jgi:hypothetical protein
MQKYLLFSPKSICSSTLSSEVDVQDDETGGNSQKAEPNAMDHSTPRRCYQWHNWSLMKENHLLQCGANVKHLLVSTSESSVNIDYYMPCSILLLEWKSLCSIMYIGSGKHMDDPKG